MVELSRNLVAARCRKGSQAADVGCATSHRAHKMAAVATLDQVGQESSTGQKAEQKRVQKGSTTATMSFDQRLRQLEQEYDELGSSLHEMEAHMKALDRQTEEISSAQDRVAKLLRREHTTTLAGLAAVKMQALGEHSRQHALDQVRISCDKIAPDHKQWGDRITNLVKAWANTHGEVLDVSQRKAIRDRFGCNFIAFLHSDSGIADTAKANAPALLLDLAMPWEERAFLMDKIDVLQPKAVHAGGRTAYLALFKSDSWQNEGRAVEAGLVAMSDSRTGHAAAVHETAIGLLLHHLEYTIAEALCNIADISTGSLEVAKEVHTAAMVAGAEPQC